MTRTLLNLLFILMLMLMGHAAHAQEGGSITEVRLSATVRMAHDAESVTLGDLARIQGPQAEALRALAIDHFKTIEPGVWTVLEQEAIREQLRNAQGINFGAIFVRGGDVQITRLRDRDALPELAHATVDKTLADDGPILREHIEHWVYARLKTKPEGTRIRFNDRDASMLETPTDGRIVEIREIGRSDLMTLGIVIYEHERIVLEQTIRFEALVNREVLVNKDFIRRGDLIAADTTRVEQRWLPSTEAIASPSSSIGQVARNTIDPGSMLLASMLEAPILVKRGQIVSARSVAGSVSVSLRVRARQNGRLGEVIELESRDRSQHFHARVAGAGRVVIVHEPNQNTPKASRAGRP